MLIDWFTVIAQVINFLILVWLLKRFLYHPILKAIDDREKRIAGQIQEAEAKKADAIQERENFRQKNEELDQQRGALLKKAETEAEAERRRLTEKAYEEYEQLRARLQESWEQERANLGREIVQRTQEEVFGIARKVLTDLAGTSLEEQMTNIFIRKLDELSDGEKGKLRQAATAAGGAITISTVFELPADRETAVEKALRALIAADVSVQFETASDEIGGIKLVAGGYQLAWTIAEYLAALEKRIASLLVEQEHEEPERTKKAIEHEN